MTNTRKKIVQSLDQVKHGSNSGGIMDSPRIISYNFNEGQRPGGMKVRAKIRIVSGKQAEATGSY
jgi:hypothetical protein